VFPEQRSSIVPLGQILVGEYIQDSIGEKGKVLSMNVCHCLADREDVDEDGTLLASNVLDGFSVLPFAHFAKQKNRFSNPVVVRHREDTCT
jgi:hypothetical protein